MIDFNDLKGLEAELLYAFLTHRINEVINVDFKWQHLERSL
jgi:hypothetical protein